MGLQTSLTKKFISRAIWLPQDWQREFDKWVEEISLLLISHSRKTFSDAEFEILNPIQDEARQAKRQNNMLAHRAALRKYGDTAKSLLLAAEARMADASATGGQSAGMDGVRGGEGQQRGRSEIDEV